MAKLVELEFLHVDHNIFLAGSNLGDKLPTPRFSSVEMAYNEETRHAYVRYNDKIMRIPEAKIFGMIEGTSKKSERLKAQTHDVVQRNPAASAQVETPYGHVHAGPGHGKTK